MTSTPPVYGLIEWDGTYTPTLIAGCCFDAIARTAIAIFTSMIADDKEIGSPDFLQQHPIPALQAASDTIADWLQNLQADTTVPYLTLLDTDEIVRTGDQLLLIDWYAAIPCTSRPGPNQPDGHQHSADETRPEVQPPTLVNGYPVVSAVAEFEHGTSWIVICRRTERMPEWAAGQDWYVTWRAWWADGAYHAEAGDFGPHHGLTWPQAQQSLLRRLGSRPAQAAAPNPGVYLRSSDDGDALTCPSCHQPITVLDGGDRLGSLLAEVTAHQCVPALT